MIDDHVHPFPLAFEPLDLAEVTLDVAGGDAAALRRRRAEPARLAIEVLRGRLGRRLGCDPSDAVGARDEAAARDWNGYVAGLFADSETTAMLMDFGWHGPAREGTEAYSRVAGVPVRELARLEPTVDALLGEGRGVAEVLAGVGSFMEERHRAGVAGFKTVLAYRTGLRVDPAASVDGAERGLGADRAAGVPERRSGKALRDLVFLRALQFCADTGLPLQVHTGFGDSEIRLAESDPLLLEEALRTPAGTSADVVLIHGSFPWHEQAAYLAGVREHVWTELSLCNLFSPVTTADRLLRLLDLAPSDRITLGSDGHGAPETHWFASVVVRDAWAAVAERLRTVARAGWIEDARARVFEENARLLYAL